MSNVGARSEAAIRQMMTQRCCSYGEAMDHLHIGSSLAEGQFVRAVREIIKVVGEKRALDFCLSLFEAKLNHLPVKYFGIGLPVHASEKFSEHRVCCPAFDERLDFWGEITAFPLGGWTLPADVIEARARFQIEDSYSVPYETKWCLENNGRDWSKDHGEPLALPKRQRPTGSHWRKFSPYRADRDWQRLTYARNGMPKNSETLEYDWLLSFVRRFNLGNKRALWLRAGGPLTRAYRPWIRRGALFEYNPRRWDRQITITHLYALRQQLDNENARLATACTPDAVVSQFPLVVPIKVFRGSFAGISPPQPTSRRSL